MLANPTYISCICATDQRPKLLSRAIYCFLNQTYCYKELIVSYRENDVETREYLAALPSHLRHNIREIQRPDNLSLGQARNEAILKAGGTHICIWDDDDWYHPERLTFQFQNLVDNNYNACVFTRIILFNSITNLAYHSFNYCWENTLLCKKEILLQNQYAHINKGEDTHIIRFLNGKKFLGHIEDAAHLYIYVYHGKNVWNETHYAYLTGKSELLNQVTTDAIKDLIDYD